MLLLHSYCMDDLRMPKAFPDRLACEHLVQQHTESIDICCLHRGILLNSTQYRSCVPTELQIVCLHSLSCRGLDRDRVSYLAQNSLIEQFRRHVSDCKEKCLL